MDATRRRPTFLHPLNAWRQRHVVKRVAAGLDNPAAEFSPSEKGFAAEWDATPAEYKAGLDRAMEKGWLVLHESGTFVKFTQAGADLFA
jgi:hypothetical protein